MTAFEGWFQYNFKDKPEEGAAYLFMCLKKQNRESVVWDWLDKTGDLKFTAETFIKAAKLILEVSE